MRSVKLRNAVPGARRRLWESRPLTRTVHRPVVELPGPPLSSFAAHGKGSRLVPPVHIEGAERVEVGTGVEILEHLELEVAPGARVRIGDGVRLGRFVSITCAVSIDIGASVSSSDYAAITDTWGPLGTTGNARDGAATHVGPPPPAAVVIEDGAYLGALCIIGPGVRVGAGAFVGEGAVVLDDVPAHSVVYGNPAVVVRDRTAGGQGPTDS
jgi:acetyltransferase-like isoleucine patch superfamily enzyme